MSCIVSLQLGHQLADAYIGKKLIGTVMPSNAQMGVVAQALHGDISQAQREKILHNFRNDKFSVLVATDVAARGLDIPNVELVVHYDLPDQVEGFLHRQGLFCPLHFMTVHINGAYSIYSQCNVPSSPLSHHHSVMLSSTIM